MKMKQSTKYIKLKALKKSFNITSIFIDYLNNGIPLHVILTNRASYN